MRVEGIEKTEEMVTGRAGFWRRVVKTSKETGSFRTMEEAIPAWGQCLKQPSTRCSSGHTPTPWGHQLRLLGCGAAP